MAKSKYIETLEEQYTKKDAKSVLRYKAPDNKWRYVQTSKDASGGTPMPSGGMEEVTWQELKDKRDNGELNPGSLYRITDYNCTTAQDNTQSAGHQFDIVLLALSENKLAEEGWAMMHENDTYFANSNLSAWKVWYCLDNDKSRFAWADDSAGGNVISINTFYPRNKTADNGGYYGWSSPNKTIYTTSETPQIGDTVYKLGKGGLVLDGTVESIQTDGTGLPNGRGVIYRLIDEFNNDIKYDFKNIKFVRKLTDGQYDADNGTDTWCYTLNVWYNDMCQDASIVGNTLPNDEGFVNGVYDNNFGYVTTYDIYLYIEGVNTVAFALGNNVVLSVDEGEYYGIYSNTIGNCFYDNTIGNQFSGNTIANGFNRNIIGSNFCDNMIGNDFYVNKIGNGFGRNIIGNACTYNTIGNNVTNTMIGNQFDSKTISDNDGYKNYGNNGVELATKDDLNQ